MFTSLFMNYYMANLKHLNGINHSYIQVKNFSQSIIRLEE